MKNLSFTLAVMISLANPIPARADEPAPPSSSANEGRAVALGATEIKMDTEVPLNAFVLGQTPAIEIQLVTSADAADGNARLTLERTDLITGEVRVDEIEVVLRAGETLTLEQAYPPVAGLFRIRAKLAGSGAAAGEAESALSATLEYACSPARWAVDLPDDWPLAAHVAGRIPPLPGFKRFRYFAHWARNNPAPDVYRWDEFDRVFEEVKNVGGKLMIAYDGSPLWTSSRGKTGMSWISNATAYPPDDMRDLEVYITEMMSRYKDDRGTIDRLELCNEPNTLARWHGTPEEYVETAIAFRQGIENAEPGHPVRLVGLAISAGDQYGFVMRQIEAGILDHVDAVSAHWYEEMMSYEKETPINNMLRHVDMLKDPMERAGRSLPMVNSECGIQFVPRENGRILTQGEINERDEANEDWNANDKWLIGKKWRSVSEYRAAAGYVAGAVMLLHEQVMPSYFFSHFSFLVDGVPSLPWVALGRLGCYLDGVDYHHTEQLEARVVGSDGGDGSPRALAYLIGRPGERQVIVAWAFLSDTSVGRSKHWQAWLEPVEVQIDTAAPEAIASDLYGRETVRLTNADGKLTVKCGEEPVFIAPPSKP